MWRGELINLRKDGTRYIEEMSITPVRDTHETIVNFIAIKRDVTERRATESALQSSEKSLANVQHMVPMGSWELESQTGELRGSPGYLRIFDIIPEAGATPFMKVLATMLDADRGRVEQSLTTALQKGESFDIEHRIVRRDGLVRVVRSRGQVVAVASYGECHIAVNGREAIAAFQAALKSGQRYNLVCMDIMMPEMDGQTAVKQIRALEEGAGILSTDGVKIFMTTVLDNVKNVMPSFQSLCDAYLFKPVDTRKLLNHLGEFQLIEKVGTK